MSLRLLLLAALAALLASPALADEGLWTFDAFPSAKVEKAYGVKIDQAWLDHVRRSAVRLTSGCSGSIVSKDGLVLTNNHCVVACAQDLSTPRNDHVKSGFVAAARAEERRCPAMQAEVLQTITDVSDRIRAAGEGKTGEPYVRARAAASSAVEQEACKGDPKLRCQVISFYRGGEYKLYTYRKYTDVRLVFAPEFQAAYFGGDPDNFNFPRFDLDCAFVRLYDDDKPLAAADHLTWNPAPPTDGEPVFVAGNPGTTNRLMTMAQLATLRDLAIPVSQLQRAELRGRMIRFSQESPERRRIAADSLFGLENSFKAFRGQQLALTDPDLMAAKQKDEADLKAKVAADPKLAAQTGDPWGEIAGAQKAYAELYLPYRQMEASAGAGSLLFDYARTLVRGAEERAKPSAERLTEFTDARLPLTEKRLLDAKPVDPGLEALNLEFWLSKTREYLTVDDPNTKLLLGREAPEAFAARLAAGSRLADPALRKALWDGGAKAIAASDDPMIRLALAMDPAARNLRKAWDEKVTGPTDRAAEKIARARFAVMGDSLYPDATFSLRLSFGKVAGWSERGAPVPPFTDIRGLYARATGAEPFALTPRWAAAQSKLNLATVLDFTTTNDIVGGNSGSPAINAKGEVIGAVFDGNIHSLGGAFRYDGSDNRTVAVSAAAITEALAKVYGQTALVAELTAQPY